MMPQVESEAIARVEYDASARTLFVRFASGEWYGYLGVAAETYRALLAAESKGRFFQEEMRDRYPFRRLEL